jgi:zona occludens toxin (predicted ATPase)
MRTLVAPPSQAQFYRAFLMARTSFSPSDFGVDLDKEAFMDQMVDDLADAYRDALSIDELLLHPREAMHFCDTVRHKHGYYDLPDDIILRAILDRRKHPGG